MYSRTHYCISSQPYIIPDGNLFSVFKSRIARIWINWMSCRINRYIGCHLTVITDFYLCHIYNCTVIICKEIFTYFYMRTIIAVKRWVNPCTFRFSQKFFYYFCNPIKIRPICKIKFLQNFSTYPLFFHNRFI